MQDACRQQVSESPFAAMAARWPSSHVARNRIGEFSGGLLKPKTMANLDSLGKGPRGRVRVGRTVGYEVTKLIEWMESRVTFEDLGQ